MNTKEFGVIFQDIGGKLFPNIPHRTTNFDGVISSVMLTSANIDERDALWEITENIKGLLIGDKGFIRPILKQELTTVGIDLQTPLRKNMKDERPKSFVKQLVSKRRLVERPKHGICGILLTVLVEKYCLTLCAF